MASNQEIKQRIMNITQKTLFRYGIKRLNMDELASKLGMSKKTLYQYFSSKKNLIEETIHFAVSGVFKKQDELMEKARTPIDKLNAMFIPIIHQLSLIDPILMKDLNRFYPDLWQHIDQRRKQRLGKLNEIIADGIKEGIFVPQNPKIIANLLIVSVTNFLSPQNLTQLGISPAEGIKTFYCSFFLGILKDEYRKETINNGQLTIDN